MNIEEMEALTNKVDRLTEILEANIARQKLTVNELKELNKKVSTTIKIVNGIMNNEGNKNGILLN